MAHKKRISMTLPEEVLNDLDFLTLNLGVSRSTLITAILECNVGTMAEVLRSCMPTSDRPDDGVVLSRNPKIVREYLDSLSTILSEAQTDFEAHKQTIFHAMDGNTHGH